MRKRFYSHLQADPVALRSMFMLAGWLWGLDSQCCCNYKSATFASLQAGALALLWIAFVGLQLAKSQYSHCTWPYLGLVLGQGIVLAGFAAVFACRQVTLELSLPPVVCEHCFDTLLSLECLHADLEINFI